MRAYSPSSVSPADQPLNPHWTGSSGIAQSYGQLGYVPGQGWGSRAEELRGEQEIRNEMDGGRGVIIERDARRKPYRVFAW